MSIIMETSWRHPYVTKGSFIIKIYALLYALKESFPFPPWPKHFSQESLDFQAKSFRAKVHWTNKTVLFLLLLASPAVSWKTLEVWFIHLLQSKAP